MRIVAWRQIIRWKLRGGREVGRNSVILSSFQFPLSTVSSSCARPGIAKTDHHQKHTKQTNHHAHLRLASLLCMCIKRLPTYHIFPICLVYSTPVHFIHPSIHPSLPPDSPGHYSVNKSAREKNTACRARVHLLIIFFIDHDGEQSLQAKKVQKGQEWLG